MSAEARAFVDLGAPTAQSSAGRIPLGPFLALTLLLPAIIVVGNFLIAVLTPITAGFNDDMILIDHVWRLVQGQYLGIDFHNPYGFGLPEVAAILWRLLGPHYYIIRASVDLFALVITLCGATVAARQLRNAAGLAALFCVTVAFVGSGPSLYGMNQYFGLACVYDRTLMAGLLVLFLQNFANDVNARPERGYIDYLIAAILLNIIFLVKISGLVIGLAIVVVGSILRGPFWRSLVGIFWVLLFFSAMVVVDFVVTGNSLSGIFEEYRMAAQGRVGAISALDVLWFSRRLPVLGVVVLMVVYTVSRASTEGGKDPFWRCCCIIAFYWMCEVVLNMSNSSAPDLIFLAPAAAVAIVTWTDSPHIASFWDRLWTRVHIRRLNDISARQLIPLLILTLVLVPEVLGSFRAVKLAYLVSTNNDKTITVSANDGIRLEILKDTYGSLLVPYVDHGIQAVKGLGASREKIANLDLGNPFPALFLAPDPKGVWVWWWFGKATNVPVGYRPSWQEVIGDACIVVGPKQVSEDVSGPLLKAVEPHLATSFTIVYEDELLRIWKRKDGCGATSSQI
jgi:hypothetical protein